MVRYKKFGFLILFLLFFSLAVSGIKFKVSVSDLVEHNQVNLEYNDVVRSQQNITTTVENTGSIGCKYRVKAKFNREDNQTDIAWSKGKGLWPGDSKLFEVRYIPLNYTGKIDTTMSVLYCGQEKVFENFTFEMQQKELAEDSLDAEVLDVNSSGAEIRTKDLNGVLAPLETPSKWKVSHSRLKDGRAYINYEPTLFNRQRTIKYVLVGENGSATGKIEVELAKEPSIYQRIKENRYLILLVVSVIVNLVLMLKVIGFLPGRLQSFKD